MNFFNKKKDKAPEQKNPLLQAYFTSLVSMILCVSMFFATTYAWFTTEVSNAGNEIYIGTLDVDLYKKVTPEKQGDPDRIDLGEEGAEKLFDPAIRWEPGYTALETVQVVNRGDLAVKYALTFTDGMLDGVADQRLMEAAKHFDVWTYFHEDGKEPTATKYSEITAADSGWKSAGTLAELLSYHAVLTGAIDEILPEEEGASVQPADEKKVTNTHTIAIHMREDASAAVMGKKITLNVKLVAYQSVKEADDFKAPYDTMAATPEELAEAFKEGGTVALATDFNLTDVATLAEVPAGKEVDLYLNGHSIHATLADPEDTATQLFLVKKGAKLTVHGSDDSVIHVAAGKSQKRVSAIINNEAGTVVLEGGKYEMEYGTYAEGYLIPTIVDNNSTLGAAKLVVNDGIFTHTRNMFRVFANHKSETASIEINGGSFMGEKTDEGTIWIQKSSATVPAGAGTLTITGGEFKYMNVYTGFENGEGKADGVVIGEEAGLELSSWEKDDGEWTAEILTATK